MEHISIEGMDGVGKSTTCQLLAEKLNYKFVEKPLHYLFDEEEGKLDNYIRIRDEVNKNPDRNFTSMFYGLGSLFMYQKFSNENIISDRHLCSNYAWSGTEDNLDVYELLLKKMGKPELTVILYSPSEKILERLKRRDSKDSDIPKARKSEEIYKKMIWFCEYFDLPYMIIDSTDSSPEEVVEKVLVKLGKNKN